MNKKNLFIYLDETGNTGLNHFDESQPFFILGAAIAESDLDVAIAAEINSLNLTARINFSSILPNPLQR